MHSALCKGLNFIVSPSVLPTDILGGVKKAIHTVLEEVTEEI